MSRRRSKAPRRARRGRARKTESAGEEKFFDAEMIKYMILGAVALVVMGLMAIHDENERKELGQSLKKAAYKRYAEDSADPQTVKAWIDEGHESCLSAAHERVRVTRKTYKDTYDLYQSGCRPGPYDPE